MQSISVPISNCYFVSHTAPPFQSAGLFPYSTALDEYRPRGVSQKSCILKLLFDDNDKVDEVVGELEDGALVADMGMFIQSVASVAAASAKTYWDLLHCVVQTMCARALKALCGVLYIVCDSYEEEDAGGGGGLKRCTWESRKGEQHVPCYGDFQVGDALPKGKRDGMATFLRLAANKRRLLDLLRANLPALLPTGEDAPLAVFGIVARRGYECVRTEAAGPWSIASCSGLDSVFCEADQALLTSCTHHFEQRGSSQARVVVASQDTDVMVGLISLHDVMKEKAAKEPVICVQRGKEKSLFNIGSTVARLNREHGAKFTKVRLYLNVTDACCGVK